MFSFLHRVTLVKSGIFDKLTDYHCHILPGVDDGIRTLEQALTVLSEYEKLGVRSVWLTPHIMEDVPNTPDKLESVFCGLKEAYCGPVELHLAAENMIDNIFEERLSSGQLIPLATDMLLVETSYYNPPMDLYGTMERIKKLGFRPLLAHPERYMYMSMPDYLKLIDAGVMFQLNLGSLTGFYGRGAKAKAEKLLERGRYSCVGTDLHSLSQLDSLCNAAVGEKYIEALLRLARV